LRARAWAMPRPPGIARPRCSTDTRTGGATRPGTHARPRTCSAPSRPISSIGACCA
jgi:hypothetical protein